MQNIKIYNWEGINQQGLRVKGTLFGQDREAIFSELRQQNIKPIKITRRIATQLISTMTSKDIMCFIRHLATLIQAGIPVARSLDIIGNCQNKIKLRLLAQQIKHDVSNGKRIYLSLLEQKIFNPLYIQLIKIGEQTGTLDTMLKKVADYSEKSYQLKSKIKKAMYYPLMMITGSFIVTALLMIFIIPRFENVYQTFDAKLPWFTCTILEIAKTLHEYWLLGFGSLVISSLVIFSLIQRETKFKAIWDHLILKCPYFGLLVTKTNTGRITGNLAIMIAGGIPLLEGLKILADPFQNQVYMNAILQMIKAISSGERIHQAMRITQAFPDMVIQMVTVGEESGTLSSTLEKIAHYFEEEVEISLANFTHLIEPLIIVILGFIIGSFVLAMYLPIFKLGAIM
jgi:type IV pilus assembly protein PilC